MLERTGRWDEAVTLADELLHTSGASSANRLCMLIRLGAMRARRGEPGVRAYLDEAAATAEQTREPQQLVPMRLTRRGALALRPARRGPTGGGAGRRRRGHCDPWLRGAVAVWLRRTGSARRARGEVARPYQLLLDGEPGRTAAAWDELGCPYEAALALADAADEVPVRESLTILNGLGAGPAGHIVRQQRRALGARSVPTGPRTATRTDPLQLTRREREVLDMIRDANTNAEIAAKLFISTGTVDHHVSAILAKLGVPTRAAAASRAALPDAADA